MNRVMRYSSCAMIWRVPREDRFKINVDASFSAIDMSGGWSFVARDRYGYVIGVGASCIISLL
jgi:hypothetical protein